MPMRDLLASLGQKLADVHFPISAVCSDLRLERSEDCKTQAVIAGKR